MREPVMEAARFIAAHACEPVTLRAVADHVGYSPFHLARAFERNLGVPPGQFLVAHRFQRAKELLLRGDERIIDICHAVGYAAVGTFTARFTAAVGTSPADFRRLPDRIAAHPPRAVQVPGGAPGEGCVTGSVLLTPAASAALGGGASVYVGLFPQRMPRGTPVAGALRGGPGRFALADVPHGRYWLLAAALPAGAGPHAQLLPACTVSGASPEPVCVTAAARIHRRDVHLDVAESWGMPVLVALPPLASLSPAGPGDQLRKIEEELRRSPAVV